VNFYKMRLQNDIDPQLCAAQERQSISGHTQRIV
jgi:hypothetical protein